MELSARSCCNEYRASLDDIALPQAQNIQEHKRFFCASRLRDFFGQQVIESLLNCTCDRCSRHREWLHLSQYQTRHIIKRIVTACVTQRGITKENNKPETAYHIILGLLLYIDAPALAIAFANQQCHDAKLSILLEDHSPEKIQDAFWPRLPGLSEPRFIARKLRDQRLHFFLPKLEAGQYTVYESNVLLPFFNEEKIGYINADGEIVSEGSYGDIYALEIPAEYHSFETGKKLWPGKQSFVRKELRDNNDSAIFEAERRKLDDVRKIKDDHIITVLKAYKHGDKRNIIFPRARTNLHHYLRDARYDAAVASNSRMENHPLWSQALGLAQALFKILNYEAEGDSRSDFLFGYHFDLKPANVLVFDNGHLVISDFGQAHFKTAGASGSKVSGFGGTESYAPPEYDNYDMPYNRKYDIWSLGCIFLEIATFVLLGTQGVSELDESRLYDSGNRCDDRFVMKDHDAWRLKPRVQMWMNDLVKKAPDGPSQDFMSRVVQLIQEMLSVHVDGRCDSRHVCWTLSDIFNQRRSSVVSMLPESVQPAAVYPPALTHQEVAEKSISQIRDLKFYHERAWKSGSLRVVHELYELYLHIREARKWQRVPMGDLRFLRLVPLYALKDDSPHKFRESSFYLLSRSTSPLPCEQFYSETSSDILYFQEALMSQKVMHHVVATRTRLHRPLERSFFKSKSRLTRDSIIEELSPTVQLWVEGFRAPKTASHSSVRPGDTYQFRPAPRRIVVFGASRIHIINIDDTIYLDKTNTTEHAAKRATHLRASKTAPQGCFKCLTVHKVEGPHHPSLPLSRESLLQEEDQNSHLLTSLELSFVTVQDMEQFKQIYRSLKYQWEFELKNRIKSQSETAMRLGYAPNSR